MESLTNRKKVVSDKPMTLWEKAYLPAIISGMITTMRHMFRKRKTIKYPEETREFAPVYRGQHVLKRDEQGRENCTACGLCALSCPAEAITMKAAERTKEELLKKVPPRNTQLVPESGPFGSVILFPSYWLAQSLHHSHKLPCIS